MVGGLINPDPANLYRIIRIGGHVKNMSKYRFRISICVKIRWVDLLDSVVLRFFPQLSYFAFKSKINLYHHILFSIQPVQLWTFFLKYLCNCQYLNILSIQISNFSIALCTHGTEEIRTVKSSAKHQAEDTRLLRSQNNKLINYGSLYKCTVQLGIWHVTMIVCQSQHWQVAKLGCATACQNGGNIKNVTEFEFGI